MSNKLVIKSGWAETKSALKNRPEKDIYTLLSNLYKLSERNKEYIHTFVFKDTEALYYYKSQIKEFINPNEPWIDGHDISLTKAKRAISDYKKASSDESGVIDLMIYYVECGTKFTQRFGDIYEEFYCSLEGMFEKAIQLIKKNKIDSNYDFIHRLKELVKETRGMGWGYHDFLADTFHDAFVSE